MTGDVITFPKREDPKVVWTCGCGCMTHYLRADGVVECASCRNEVTEGDWRARLPDTPAEPEPATSDTFSSTDVQSDELSIRRVIKAIVPAEAALVALVRADGSICLWSDWMEGPERHAWLRDKLAMIETLAINQSRGA